MIFFVGWEIQNVFAYSVETHAGLTKEIFQFYNKHSAVNKIPDSLKNYLIEGSRQEDMPPRWFNHYYDPVYGRGLTSALYGNWDQSKTWAQAPKLQNQLVYKVPVVIASILTAIQEKQISAITNETDFTWQKAIEFWNQGEKEKALYALGHILHLIEDASVPDHTRNDPHPALNHNDSFGTGSPYELWTEQFTAENIDLSKKLADKTLILLDNLDSYFDSIASYSNNNFYSKDTIGLGEYKIPEVLYFGSDKSLPPGYVYGFKTDENKNDYHLVLTKNKSNFLWLKDVIPLQGALLDDELILQDYWSRLSTKAVQHGAGVIDLFFKEVEKVKGRPAAQDKSQSFFAELLNTITPSDNFQPVAEIPLEKTDNQSKEVPLPNLEVRLPVDAPAEPVVVAESAAIVEPFVPAFQSCSFNTSQSPSRQDLIINEVAWMGTTVSANDEWIELKNISNSALNLSGWQILDQAEQIKIIFENNIIPAGGFALLERTDDNTVPNITADFIYTGALSNTNEGLRLFNKDCVLVDEVLANPDWLAGNNTEKKTLERDVIGFGGSTGSPLSWHTSLNINGTPRAENTQVVAGSSGGGSGGSSASSLPSSGAGAAPVVSSPPEPSNQEQPVAPSSSVSAVNHLVISEILFDAEAADTGKEFIELYNPTDQAINLENWSIQHLSGTGTLSKKNFEPGNQIQPKSFFLIWLGDDVRADLQWQSGSLNNTGATIFLVSETLPVNSTSSNSAAVIDRLAYGTGEQLQPEMVAMSLTGFIPGQSLERKAWQNNNCVSAQNNNEFLGNGCDTNNNSADFEIRPIPNPQNSAGLPEPRQAPTAARDFNAEYNSTTLSVVLSWSPSHDFNNQTSTLIYNIFEINSPPVLVSTTTNTSFVRGINEIGRNYNFEITAVDSGGLSSATASTTAAIPGFLNNIYFYRDPRINSAGDYLVDLHYQNYPFVKKSLFGGGPDGSWKLAVFYLNKDAEQIPYFYSDQQFSGTPDNDPVKSYGQWGTAISGALKIKYGACTGYEFISTSLILPDSPARCSVNYGGYRNLTMSWGYFSEDPHLLLNFDQSQFSEPLTSNDYITAAFYSYSDFNTQTLVAVDKNKYFFQENVPSHQAPLLNGEINLDFNPDNSLVYADWPKATDPDTADSAITYEVQYVPVVSLPNHDSGIWYNLGAKKSAARFALPETDFNVKVRAKDDLGNYSEELTAVFNSGDFDSVEPPFLISSLTCGENNDRFSNKLAFKYVSAADDEIINRIKLSQRYYDREPLASVKVYSYANDVNPEAGDLLGVSNEISAISPYPVYQEYDYDFPEIRLGANGSAVWFVVENAAGGSTLETKTCEALGEFLINSGSWFKWPYNRQFWRQVYYN
ncbi:MAG: lamin tail domain-containing protein [Candidatus Brennerbacteria bacterium]|nr:lamin tail domain-containing protein [Candidatus Brennerbacteria bacterium]